ncbi:MAG: PadR family transcriptional regulator [Lachnospiraceae bacterium]
MAIDRTLISGSMAMMILGLLSEKDMYGYEMIDTLRKRSQNVFELKAGTLYPLLHNLEEKHFLVSYEEEVLGKRRKYYSVTKEGKKHLERKKSEWQEYSRAVTHVLALEV